MTDEDLIIWAQKAAADDPLTAGELLFAAREALDAVAASVKERFGGRPNDPTWNPDYHIGADVTVAEARLVLGVLRRLDRLFGRRKAKRPPPHYHRKGGCP